jgi:hypothetical protein
MHGTVAPQPDSGIDVTVTRILFLARYRVPHALLTLQFDHFVEGIDTTVIATPMPKEELWPIFERHGIDTTNFRHVHDSVILQRYPEIEHWMFPDDYRGPWLRQQAIKLSYLDYLDYDVMLMQDPDMIMVEPYRCWNNNQLKFLALQNETHGSYDGVMESVLGIPRQTPHCFVTEMVPVVKQDWQQLRKTLEQRHRRHFLDGIIDHVQGMPTVPPWGTGNLIKWFSEYEFLGNWALTQRPVEWQWQRRFEYDSLDKMKNFTQDYNCFADAIPDLRLSLQYNWDTGIMPELDHYVNLVKQCIK